MKNKLRLVTTVFLSLIVACGGICANSYAAVPHLINYQGRLTDSGGVPLNGSYNLTFRIYDAETAGNLLWEEAHAGAVIQKGIFSILLGSVTNLNLAFDKPYFLEIKVGEEVMSPRQQITSAGYAIRAEHGVPKGVIVMWSGSISNIPDGWILCDGTHGTPDLSDRFIIGAKQDDNGIAKTTITGSLTQLGDGQLSSHNHSAGSLIISNSGAHIHSLTSYYLSLSGQESYPNPPAGLGARNYSHSLQNTYNTDNSGEHTHTLSGSTATSGTGTKNIAVYYALAFIMKL